jgi:hypothetical protein
MARSKSPIGSRQKDAPAGSVVNPVTSDVPHATATHAVTSGTSDVEATTRPDTKRNLGVVKSDSRPHVVPINLEDEIRRRAYELAERRGFSNGHETEDWLAAEREVLQRYRQQSA